MLHLHVNFEIILVGRFKVALVALEPDVGVLPHLVIDEADLELIRAAALVAEPPLMGCPLVGGQLSLLQADKLARAGAALEALLCGRNL